jgi:hypothetical protein
MALQGSGRRTGDDDVELDGLSVVRVEETSCGGRFTGALLCHRRSGGAGKLCRLAGKGGGNGHAIWRYPHALDLDTRNSNHQSKGEDECQQRIGQRERDSAARNLYRKRHTQTQYLHIQVRRAGGNDDLARAASIAQKPSDVGGREHHRCLTVTKRRHSSHRRATSTGRTRHCRPWRARHGAPAGRWRLGLLPPTRHARIHRAHGSPWAMCPSRRWSLRGERTRR